MSIQLQEIKNIFIKNLLTEGVDFKRYEWLKGDNTATIKWYANLWINQLHTVIGKDKKVFIYSKDWSNNTKNLVLRQEGTQLTVIFRSGTANWSHIADYAQFTSMPDIVDFKFYINNNIAYCERNGELFTGYNMQSYWNDNAEFSIYGGKMKLLQEYDSVNDKLISSLTPCQLLKPIPSSLDANNIARSSGECGMYDSISGKFYGNVNNSGTFTVEGEVEPETHTVLQQIYQNKLIEDIDYETYDWLKVNTTNAHGQILMQLPINSKNFEFKRNWIQVQNSEYFRVESNYFYFISDFPNNVNNRKVCVYNSIRQGDEYVDNYVQSLGIIHEVKCTDETCSINERVIPWYGNNLNTTMDFYNTGADGNKAAIFLTSPIVVDGEVRYVPCKLLHNIPLNLDAQCKSRQIGECGFVDLKTGKFYGNVADSGTFTVENDNNE